MATASDTPTHVPSQPSRRAMLATLAAAPIAGVPAAANTVGHDPHPEWYRRAMALADQEGRDADRDADQDHLDSLTNQRSALEDLALQTPAQTLPGVVAQLKMTLWMHDMMKHDPPDWDDIDGVGLRHAIATLDRLAGGRA